MLTIEQAQYELKIAVQNNPGPWEQHSLVAADNARRIAEKVPGMNPEKAYIMGLLHDIGRRVGVTGMRHSYDGYTYLMKIEQPEIAPVCLSHSYPIKDADMFCGKHDCTEEEKTVIREFLQNRAYDDYDLLIQLCDAISLPTGPCIMEKRLVDVILRHGILSYSPEKWKKLFEIKKYFDTLCGRNIYTLLPSIMENSMENLI
jgi:hypothetical protein